MNLSRFIILLLSLAAIASALIGLRDCSRGLVTQLSWQGDIPVTVFHPAEGPAGPVVVIAHGFAGSQQLMQPLAMTLAHAGYTAVTFDFAGHGRNAQPLAGGLTDMDASTRALEAEIDRIVVFARSLSPASQTRLALAGHSMAADLVTQYAMNKPDIAGVVAMSLFGGGVTADEPRNLLVVYGAWEPSMLIDAGYRIIGLTAEGVARAGVTYGDVAQGTGRRLALAAGAEHIGVIYSHDGLVEALNWLNGVFGRDEIGDIDSRGKWLALLFVGLVALVWPLARLLPDLSRVRLGAGLNWRGLPAVALAPAVLTPVLLWKAPTNFLPILLGDYLVMHFMLYGFLTMACLWLTRSHSLPARLSWTWPLLACALTLAGFYIVVQGWAIDTFVTSFMPNAIRWPVIPAMFAGVAIYFLADEWIVRGAGAASGAYAFTKVCFVASLLLAIALNPSKLFFLAIIAPVIAVVFIMYGLISAWVYARTGDPRVAAIGNAAGLAWAIAVTFPIVG